MKRIALHTIALLILVFGSFSCQEILEPKPVDLLTDDLVLNEPNDVQNVEIGLYSSFRGILSNAVIAEI
jgi:hypothetical protein